MTPRTSMVMLVPGAVLVAALVVAGCGRGRLAPMDASSCRTLDSLYEQAGFERRVSINGKVTVDAEQYRVRGQIGLDIRAPGEVVLEFTSTVLFGQAREDIVFSSLGDTLRIIDRERGAYYEGEEADTFLRESLETDLDFRRVLDLSLGGRPPCDALSDVRFEVGPTGEIVCAGRHLGERFRAVFGPGGRLQEVEWPVRSGGGVGVDKLKGSYRWTLGPGGERTLEELVMSLERREWRCKIKRSG